MLVLSPNATLYNKDGVTDANNHYDDCADYISALKNIELVSNNMLQTQTEFVFSSEA